MTKGQKVIVVGSVITVLTLATVFIKKAVAAPAPVQWPQFTPQHLEVQSRIDRVLGSGFPDWKKVDWMHWPTLENAAQGIFAIATGSDGSYPAVNPGDSWQAYAYPSSQTVVQYGNNLGYYVRCAPKNIGCQLFGKDISTKTAIMFVAGLAVTAATAGIAGVAVLPAIAAAGISSGAAIVLPEGQTKDQVVAAANQYIKSNPDQYKPASGASGSAFAGCAACADKSFSGSRADLDNFTMLMNK